MKIRVYFDILILIIALLSVSAAYLPNPEAVFTIKGATCFDNGTIRLNITHEGAIVKFSDVKITADSDKIKNLTLIGEWLYPEDYKIPENYTNTDYTSKTKYYYKTTNSMFTEGKYIITLSWPSNTIYYDKTMAAVTCPGIKCIDDNQCISQQKCVNSTCKWLECAQDSFAMGHSCLKKCEDYSKCTNDYYIENQCVHIKIKDCCNDDKDCEDSRLECNNNKCEKKYSSIFIRFWNWLKSKYE